MSNKQDPDEHTDSPSDSTQPPQPGLYMQPPTYVTPANDDEIDLKELMLTLWRGRWIILAVTAAFALGSIVLALLLTDIYRAEAVLTPAEQRQSGSPLASQLGGAAALVGINIGQQGEGRVGEAINVLRSREFTREFVSNHDLVVPLMAGRCCDANGNNLIDSDVYDIETQSWLTESGAPSDWDVYRKFNEIRNVAEDLDTGLVRVSIEWHDPWQAAEWTNWLVEDINSGIKERDLDEANNAIAYLRQQLENTALVEMRQIFYQLIESQTRTVMLANVRDEYVLRVIDPAVVPEEPVRPRRRLIFTFGFLIGFSLGIMAVVSLARLR